MTHEIQPTFFRLPKEGSHMLCPYTGLSRATLDLLTRPQERNSFNPPVLSRIVKQPGTSRGVRLIDYQDCIRYLNTLSNSGKEEAK